MYKTRFNEVTRKLEFWNQPEGLPGIWMEFGFCDRCTPYKKCMGFLELSEAEWQEAEQLIAATKDALEHAELLNSLQRESCESKIGM